MAKVYIPHPGVFSIVDYDLGRRIEDYLPDAVIEQARPGFKAGNPLLDDLYKLDRIRSAIRKKR